MYLKLIKPFRSHGRNSRSWQIVIPAPIVKEHQINESTIFIVDHNDHGITLSYANVEYKNHPVSFALENSSRQVMPIVKSGGQL